MSLIPDKISAKEIADELGYSERYVKDTVTKSPKFPRPFKIGRNRFWLKTEVRNWINTQRES